MRTVGLIVEYNPLHNGHVYHFHQSKSVASADAAVAVMSGHFLQRGEPAVVNKWARAEMALRMGADVVLELPVAYSSQPAEWFAYGACSALHATGVVDAICFGSESGSIDWLDELADSMCEEDGAFRTRLRELLATGLPYPTAYSQAVADSFRGIGYEELAKPNNTLGLHYLIALKRLRSPIRTLTIERTKAGYNQSTINDASIASATAIRKLLFEERSLEGIAPYVPAATVDIMRAEWAAGRAPVSWDRFARALLHMLLSRTAESLSAISEVNEGLEYRLLQALPRLEMTSAGAVERLIGLVKTKRYTRTKLQRTLLRILLGHTKEQLSPEILRQGVPYLRVLGFTARGRELLKTMKRTASVPIVSKVSGIDDPMLLLDIQATSVYSLGYERPDGRAAFRDYYEPPIRL